MAIKSHEKDLTMLTVMMEQFARKCRNEGEWPFKCDLMPQRWLSTFSRADWRKCSVQDIDLTPHHLVAIHWPINHSHAFWTGRVERDCLILFIFFACPFIHFFQACPTDHSCASSEVLIRKLSPRIFFNGHESSLSKLGLSNWLKN